MAGFAGHFYFYPCPCCHCHRALPLTAFSDLVYRCAAVERASTNAVYKLNPGWIYSFSAVHNTSGSIPADQRIAVDRSSASIQIADATCTMHAGDLLCPMLRMMPCDAVKGGVAGRGSDMSGQHRDFRPPKAKTLATFVTRVFGSNKPDDDLLSHWLQHYHRREVVSRSCSGWEGVVPTCYSHQA